MSITLFKIQPLSTLVLREILPDLVKEIFSCGKRITNLKPNLEKTQLIIISFK